MSVKQQIFSQFKQPHGCLGQLAGMIMANRSSNIERNDWTLDLLDLKPDDRVLEIGFGPGIAIEKASRIVTSGLIVGIDHSQTMLQQASRRNALAIDQGRVQLHLGSVELLASLNLHFTKVYSSNVVQFWDNPEKYFAYLYDALSSGGNIATTYMPRHAGASISDARDKAVEIEHALKEVGFKDIKVKERPFKLVSAICVLASK